MQEMEHLPKLPIPYILDKLVFSREDRSVFVNKLVMTNEKSSLIYVDTQTML